jgi:hypothetical protein
MSECSFDGAGCGSWPFRSVRSGSGGGSAFEPAGTGVCPFDVVEAAATGVADAAVAPSRFDGIGGSEGALLLAVALAGARDGEAGQRAERLGRDLGAALHPCHRRRP